MKFFTKYLIFILLTIGFTPLCIAKKPVSIETPTRYQLDSIDGCYIPRDIYDVFVQIDTMLPDTVKKDIMNMSEDEFLGRSHMGLGMALRNDWGLWGGSRLSKYFNDLGIFHPDDMSGIIMCSYYRHILNQDIKLSEQVAYYKNYWKEMEERVIKPKKRKKNR